MCGIEAADQTWLAEMGDGDAVFGAEVELTERRPALVSQAVEVEAEPGAGRRGERYLRRSGSRRSDGPS